ncbi:MAG: GNAT family N-acetyltransferase [Sphingobacteriia bacterium]|nr:MAG: GNAT family N-acetyltransferase [Sphingobacteriia bacterium]
MEKGRFQCKSFGELSTPALYAILQLRNEVFVVEQNCVFQDADNKDQGAYHLTYEDKNNGQVLAYCRLLPPGLAYAEMSIGRVVNSPSARGTGVGKTLMNQAIAECRRLFGPGPIRIGAQSYLLGFYGSLGFVPEGPEYLEDGIPHTEMVLR